MSPIFDYVFRDLFVYHEMDLDTDMVHVTVRGYYKPIMRFNSDCYAFDRNDKQIGKISLDRNSKWFYTPEDKSFVILGKHIDICESVLQLEKEVVKHYLNEQYDDFIKLIEVEKGLKKTGHSDTAE